MSNLSNGEWLAIIAIVVTIIIGAIQILRKTSTKPNKIEIKQKSGAFSSGKQKIKVKQNDK